MERGFHSIALHDKCFKCFALLFFSFSSSNLSYNVLQTTDDSDRTLCVALYCTRCVCFEVEVNPL